jgi:hypothetical protein
MTSPLLVAALGRLLLVVLAPAEAGAGTPPAAPAPPPADDSEPPTCDPSVAGPDARPPDPRCHEALDGRVAAGTPVSVPRVLLFPPQMLARAVFWPIVKAGDFIEYHKVLWWMDALLTTDDRLIGLRPELQYSTGFISTFGARLFDRRLPLPGSEAVLRYRGGGATTMLAEGSLSGPAWLGLALHASWNRRPDRLFAGIGPATLAQLVADGRGVGRYASDAWVAEGRWLRPLPLHLAATLLGDVQRRDYRAAGASGGPSIASFYGLPPADCTGLGLPDGCVDPALVPGFDRGLRIFHAGAGLSLDLRDRARDGSGVTLAVEGRYGQGLGGDPSRHLRLAAEIVVALGGHDRELLIRGRGEMVERLGASAVPFEELVLPAGQAGMRGMPDGRFRGPSGIVGSVEYRWFIAYNLDAFLFADAGTVAGTRFSGLASGPVYPSFGFGIRRLQPTMHYWEAPLLDGVQIAYATEPGLRLMFSVAAF